jgi:L-fuconolactonase
LAPIYRDVSIADWRVQSAGQGVHGGVLVQAAPTESETRFLLAQAEQNADVLGVVGWVEWLAPDAAERIRVLARHPRLKGLRPMLQDIADATWILQPGLHEPLAAMVECGLVFDALVQPRHLQSMLTLAQRHPQLQIVIDHCAKPDIASRQRQPWADDMARLATETNAVCKLSGLLTEAGPQATPDTVAPWVRHVLDCFGPERLLWGSDWPVLELSGLGYVDWWSATGRLLAGLTPAERAAVLGGNAAHIYRLKPAA